MITFVDWSGWMVLVLTYLLIFFYCSARVDSKLFVTLFFVLSLHHVVALMNAYMKINIAMSVDALTFYKDAVNIAYNHLPWNFASGPNFYRLVLGFLYKLFGPSFFLGEELSIFVFLLSCLVFIKIYKILGYTKHIYLLILVYGSLPSMILFGSVTLRESWQILFFMLTIYFCLKNLFHDSLSSWFYACFFSFVFALFHEGFVIFDFLLAGIMVFYQLLNLYNKKYLKRSGSHLFSILLTIITSVFMIVLLHEHMGKTPELEAFHALSGGKAINFIVDYHTRVLTFASRTNYGAIIDATSFGHLLLSLVLGFLYYMFAPFPWEISNMMDVYALFESLVRFLLIVSAIIVLWKVENEKRKQIGFLFLIYLLMSALWSFGTLNYGTSIRHHIVSYWILVLLFGAYLHQVTWPRFYISHINAVSAKILPKIARLVKN